MNTILFYGGYAIAAAGLCKLLERIGQSELENVVHTLVKLSLMAALGYEMYRHAWMIIEDFGGLPRGF